MKKGKNIILTGATGGLGSEISKLLVDSGVNLLLVSKDAKKLQKLQELLLKMRKGAFVKFIAVDFNNPEKVEESVDDIVKIFEEKIDVLINNAGIGYHSKITSIGLDELKEVFAVNTLSPIILTSKLFKNIAKSDFGHIINISSILGSRAMDRTATYTASKHALNGFAKVLRIEGAKHKIHVTTIEPGAIETSFIERTHDTETKKHFSKRKLIKIEPKIIADWVLKVIETDTSVCPEIIQIMPQDQVV
ncbi:MAG TPA: SDR family oxidoreductase [Ignavibacteria bacterium]|nr:SDR family oxidoreductase [Ignavibacteria bacterium]